MKNIIKKHWFLIILTPLLIALIVLSCFKLTAVNKYKTMNSLEKTKVFASMINLEKDADFVVNELDIVYNKYLENGFNTNKKNDDLFTCLKILGFTNEKYTIFNNLELYLLDNNIKYETREETLTKNEGMTTEEQIVLLNLYYMEYLFPTAREIFMLNEKEKIEEISKEVDLLISENIKDTTMITEEQKETILLANIDVVFADFITNYKSKNLK